MVWKEISKVWKFKHGCQMPSDGNSLLWDLFSTDLGSRWAKIYMLGNSVNSYLLVLLERHKNQSWNVSVRICCLLLNKRTMWNNFIRIKSNNLNLPILWQWSISSTKVFWYILQAKFKKNKSTKKHNYWHISFNLLINNLDVRSQINIKSVVIAVFHLTVTMRSSVIIMRVKNLI